ncbi:hypothetical protein JCM11641_000204, partial [Rhodosporidiobolus odoratus]
IGHSAHSRGIAVLGPVVGSFAAQYVTILLMADDGRYPVTHCAANAVALLRLRYENWKWTILELLWMSGAGLLVFTFFLPETFGPTILKRRAERLRKITGNPLMQTREELHAQEQPGILKTGAKQIGLAFRLCLEPAVGFANLYIGLIYSIFYLWFEAFPIVFSEYHGFSLSISNLPFLAFLVTAAMTITVFCLYQKYRLIPKLVESDFKLAPEARLELAVYAAPFIPISLFIFGWT